MMAGLSGAMPLENGASWADYPLSSAAYEPSLYNGTEIRQQLRCPPTNCFSEEDTAVRIFDIQDATQGRPNCCERLCTSPEEVEDAISSTKLPRIRIISVHSIRTISPLQISAGLMQRILSRYQVAPEFVPVIFSFGDDPDMAESGNSHVYIQTDRDRSKRLSYEIRYMEKNRRTSASPWSQRHTGVYHHHTKEHDLWILLQSVPNSTAEERLRELIPPSPINIAELGRLCENPFRIHLLLASSYFGNWRWYLRDLAKKFNEMNDLAMTFQHEITGPGSVTFSCVQSLRNIQDLVLSTKANCKGDLQILQGLINIDDQSVKELHGLPFQATQLQGFIDSAEVLQGRIRNTIDLIGYTLDRHNQIETANVYHELRDVTAQLRDLTQSTVDDSATVKIITLVSAFYLPGSFVATLYGMNFFIFNTTTNSIAVADDFWIFVITWIPLSLLTAACYATVRYRSSKVGVPKLSLDSMWQWLSDRSRLREK